MAKILLALFLAATVFASTPTLHTLKDYPRSLAKDFYIWFFLQGNISSSQADNLFSQTYRVGWKLLKAYAKKSHNKALRKSLKCSRMGRKTIQRSKDLACITMALSPYKAAQLPPRDRRSLQRKLQKTTPSMSRWLKSMSSTKRIEETFKDNPKDFLMLFRRSGKTFKNNHYNKSLSYDFLKTLSTLKGFGRFVEEIAINDKYQSLQKNLASFPASQDVSTRAHFYLALIKIKQGKDFLALNNLSFVAERDYYQMNRDKALFWSYLITHKKRYLEKLYVSLDLNIYTIYAAELLGEKYIGSYKPQLVTRISALYDESDPFVWSGLLLKDRNMSAEKACADLKLYNNNHMQALYAFYLEKCGKYAIHPYVTPYIKELKGLSASSKSLFYAIGRQESRLMAGGISHVFAMGLMQIMPFLSKAIAKQKKQKLYLPDMFQPKKNIEFAKHHLKNLQRRLHHPLFIAYAYNGGRGYLRKQIRKGLFRKSDSKYEPFLSIETLSYPETREYGKKVLANYIVYNDMFDNPISLIHLLRTLK